MNPLAREKEVMQAQDRLDIPVQQQAKRESQRNVRYAENAQCLDELALTDHAIARHKKDYRRTNGTIVVWV